MIKYYCMKTFIQKFKFFRRYSKSDIYQNYLLKYGERPRYIEENRKKISKNLISFLLIVGLVPLVITPQYINYWILDERKNGDRKLNF